MRSRWTSVRRERGHINKKFITKQNIVYYDDVFVYNNLCFYLITSGLSSLLVFNRSGSMVLSKQICPIP